MFNIVKYRYWFLIVSLIVIIPGTLSLIIFGLNAGTDFLGGSSVDIRPQTAMTDAQIKTLLKPLNLKDQQVVIGNNAKIDAKKTIWIKLNTPIDKTVSDAIQNALQKKYADSTKLSVDIKNITVGSEKPFALVTVSNFATAPQEADIKAALTNLPKTTDVANGASSSQTASTTATPVATATTAATPVATATTAATPVATATTAATPAATATPTPAANAGTIPVSVEEVKQGQVTQTINIITRTNISTVKASSKDSTDLASLQETILKGGGPYIQVLNNTQIGASVADDTKVYSVLAVLASSVLILLYVWYAFRKVPKAWRYGACAIIALLHDVLVVLGIFSILGHFFGVQVDALFITALLTVVGFSVHDTIVVFDRIRENMRRRTVETFDEVVNASLVQTMARSLNTSLTVLFTLLTLTLFTGSSSAVHTFTLALLIGIFSGTYSSIFNASMLLVIWENGELGLGRLGGNHNKVSPTRREREARELANTRS